MNVKVKNKNEQLIINYISDVDCYSPKPSLFANRLHFPETDDKKVHHTVWIRSHSIGKIGKVFVPRLIFTDFFASSFTSA